MPHVISRRTLMIGGALALTAALAGPRLATAQTLVGPSDGAPTLVMFHVEAGW